LLANANIAKPNTKHGFQLFADGWHRLEIVNAFFDRHIQNIGNGFAAPGNFQRFPIVTASLCSYRRLHRYQAENAFRS
jgi:hypothetical protein